MSKVSIAGFVCLAKPCKGCKGVALAITGMTAAAGGSNKHRPQPRGWSKDFIVKCDIPSQKTAIFLRRQAL
jgi:hypothetical protein